MIDLHIHVLSGLDDGADDVSASLQMCRLAAADGETTLVAAAHMFDGMHDVSRPDLLRGVQSLRDALDAGGLSMRIEPAGDTHIGPDLADRFRAGETVTIGDAGRYLLVEFPRDIVPPGARDVLFELMLEDVTPIITHPERNREIQNCPEVLADLVREGVLSQLTAGSLLGRFGETTADCARELLTRNMAHVVASDAHSPIHRAPGLARARRMAADLVGEERADQIFEFWPGDILAGRPVNAPQPRKPDRKKAWFLSFA